MEVFMAEGADVKKNSFYDLLKLILGIVIVVTGVALTIVYFPELANLFKGMIGLILILVGLIVMAVAKE
jgi:hypothetical protein